MYTATFDEILQPTADVRLFRLSLDGFSEIIPFAAGQFIQALAKIPEQMKQILNQADDAKVVAERYLDHDNWLYLGRGKHRERRDADGFLVGDATDEVPSRGIWRHYRSLMEAA